ncbi:MAG TPA: sigma-70 family RNA polymerase sigma factor [Candidatus Paceibacterota bacterium]|jgi:RNA polymerase sigma-70 factor (ECF subfamily)|nr:sigma-70 family RNA polymerase sigma factor [Candidatus Paceibacterota bacterium]
MERLPKVPIANIEGSIDYKNVEDLTLTKAIAEGNNPAFEEIYERYHRRTYLWCLKILSGNVGVAEDTVQEVFLHLRRTAGTFRGDSSFATWFYKLTLRKCIDYMRKYKDEFKSVDFENEEVKDFFLNQRSRSLNPEEELMGKSLETERLKKLELILSCLTSQEKNIFILKVFQKKNFREIEEQTNIPLRNASRIYYGSLKKIAGRLNVPESEFLEFLTQGNKKITRTPGKKTKVSKDSSSEVYSKNGDKKNILGVSLEEFRKLRNKLSLQQNIALALIYERGLDNNPKKVAEILKCDPKEAGAIVELAKENLKRLQNNQPLQTFISLID